MHNQLTCYEDFVSEYKRIEASERQIMQEIAGLFEKEVGLKHEMQSVRKRMPNVSLFSGDADQLADKVNFTSTLAANVSSKVKQLDFTKMKVADALKLTNDILDLKYCAQNIEKALNDHDYEVAAVSIHRFLSIDEAAVLKSGTTSIRGW